MSSVVVLERAVAPAVRAVPPGPAAHAALREWITAVRDGDPLAPLTVVAPSPAVALTLRRSLARGSDGVVAVRVTVLEELAALLSAPARALAPRPPLTPALRRHLVRLALRRRPGALAGAAAHPATAEAADLALSELRRATAAGGEAEVLAALRAGPPPARALAGLHTVVRGLARDHEDDQDVQVAAAWRAGTDATWTTRTGPIALFLLPDLPPAARAFTDALALHTPVTILTPATPPASPPPHPRQRRVAAQPTLFDALAAGDAAAGGEGAGGAVAAGEDLRRSPTPAGVGLVAPEAVRVVAAVDQDAEVRWARREVARLLRDGVAPEDVAVLWAEAEPYATLTREAFAAAGLPLDAPAAATPAQSVPGRTLLGLLALEEQGWARGPALDWLTLVAPPLAGAWAATARAAGVTGGREQWRTRLAGRADAAALLELLERCWAWLDRRPTRWGDTAAWLAAVLDDLVVEASEAAELVRERCAALAALDAVPGPAPDLAAVVQVLGTELAQPGPRTGTPGAGVHLGPLTDAPTLAAPHVLVLGLAEGALPARQAEQPLLPDGVRRRLRARHPGLPAAQALPTATEQRARARAALAAALRPGVALLFPLADRRRQRERVPAPWLLEVAGSAAGRGRPLRRDELAGPASPEAALRDAEEPATAAEWIARAALRDPAGGAEVLAADPLLAAGIAVERARAAADFSPWDGRVGPHPHLDEHLGGLHSPTRLAAYGTCPRQYFLRQVLGVAVPDDADEGPEVGALRRGAVLHATLERFLRATAGRTLPPEEERAALREAAAIEFAQARRAGGSALLWDIEEDRQRSALDRWLEQHRALPQELGVHPLAAEQAFGSDGEGLGELTVDLPRGGALRFGGRVDRVDAAPAGEVVLVTDYKTGSEEPYRGIDEDPVLRGTQLQLAVYALLAAARWPDAEVHARYWFLGPKATRRGWRGFVLDPAREAAAREALDVVADGIAGGVFPARPGEYDDFRHEFANCRTCPFQRVCPSPGERDRAWQRARAADEVARYATLAEGPS